MTFVTNFPPSSPSFTAIDHHRLVPPSGTVFVNRHPTPSSYTLLCHSRRALASVAIVVRHVYRLGEVQNL